MRLIFKTICLVLFLSANSYSQDGLLFKTEYMPNSSYKNNTVQKNITEVTFIGSEEFLQKLKDKGINNPTTKEDTDTIETLFKTGKLSKNNLFPVNIEYIKANDSKIVGTKLFGNILSSNLLTIDSIYSPSLDEASKNVLLNAVQSSFLQISFPDRRLKIGDEFIDEQPLLIPSGQSNVKMLITTKYKLIKMSNGVANFNISINFTMNTEIENNKIKASGTGNGEIVFDIKSKYPIHNETNSMIEMLIPANNYSLRMKILSHSIQNTKIITPN